MGLYTYHLLIMGFGIVIQIIFKKISLQLYDRFRTATRRCLLDMSQQGLSCIDNILRARHLLVLFNSLYLRCQQAFYSLLHAQLFI